MADLGISALSRHSVTLELDVQDFPLMRSWYVVYHEAKQLFPTAQAFIDFILYQPKTVASLCNRLLETHFVAQ